MKTHVEGNVTLHHVAAKYAESNCWGSKEDLSDYDARDLASQGIVEAWYWYIYGSYEGTGELIGRKADGSWALLSLSHCSCNSPCDDDGSTFANLSDLAAFSYRERSEGIAEILAAAQAATSTTPAQEATQ